MPVFDAAGEYGEAGGEATQVEVGGKGGEGSAAADGRWLYKGRRIMRHDQLRSLQDFKSEEETEEVRQNMRQRQGATPGSQHFIKPLSRLAI